MVSLFDEYPNDETAPADEHDCCDQWAAFVAEQTGGIHMVWHVLHRFAHGRLPFRLEALADLAGVDLADAYAALDTGIERGWVCPVPPENYMAPGTDTGLYQGCLARWR